MPTARCVGTWVKRKEDVRLITGSSSYVDDIKLADQAFAVFARSQYAHARLRKVDISLALSRPGVLFGLTGKEFELQMFVPSNLRQMSYPLLARDKVRFVGEPIAVLVARSRAEAEDALEAVEIEYEVLPAVTDPEKALLKESALVHEDWKDNIMLDQNYEFGNVKEAFSSADLIVAERLTVNRISGSPIEPRGIVAAFDKISGQLVLWVSTQFAHAYRSMISSILHYPENRIRVIVPEVGGGFGVKLIYQDEVVVCHLAMKLRRPVKWIETRTEHLTVTNHARGQTHEVEAAFRSDGTLLGIRDHLVADMGAYWSTVGWDPVRFTMDFLPGPYRVRNYATRMQCAATNKVFYGALRGFGMIVGNFVIERVMDIAARKLEVDPADIRMKNVIRSNEFPYKAVTGLYFDNNSFRECLLDILQKADYASLRKFQEQARKENRHIGIGLSMQVECSAPNEEATVGLPGFESAAIKVDPNGYVTVETGLCPQGQGTETTLAQIVSDELSVPFEDITVVHGDSSVGPYGMGNWGSRGAVAGGGAVLGATKLMRDKILKIASHLLEADVEDLELENSSVAVKGASQRSISIRDIAFISYNSTKQLPAGMDPSLDVKYHFNLPNIQHPNEKGEANLNTNYSNATHLAMVEVDPETGMTKILKYFVAHDCGTVINPVIVEGQIVGGTATGIGNALYEQVVYDEEGNNLTDNFLNYLLPTSLDVPNVMVNHRVTPSPTVPGGFKGCGEGGSIAAPAAILNSINDALSIPEMDLNLTPAKPEVVWQALSRNSHRKKKEKE